jgi:hypothetical protein
MWITTKKQLKKKICFCHSNLNYDFYDLRITMILTALNKILPSFNLRILVQTITAPSQYRYNCFPLMPIY